MLPNGQVRQIANDCTPPDVTGKQYSARHGVTFQEYEYRRFAAPLSQEPLSRLHPKHHDNTPSVIYPLAAVHTSGFPEFSLWQMSRVKHETGREVHHGNTLCMFIR